jgi:hypothetical protein
VGNRGLGIIEVARSLGEIIYLGCLGTRLGRGPPGNANSLDLATGEAVLCL